MPGHADQRDAHLRRLRRIEGQIRRLRRMVVDDEVSSIEVLAQVSATTGALRSVALRLLTEHTNRLILEAARSSGPDSEAKMAEAQAAIARIARS